MTIQNQYEQQLISMITDTRKKMKTNIYLEEALITFLYFPSLIPMPCISP